MKELKEECEIEEIIVEELEVHMMIELVVETVAGLA